MYYQNYEDYMRSVLGYPIDNSYTYDNYITQDNRNYNTYENMEELYPNIYKEINPFVCKECDGYTGPITKEVVDSMVDKIYSNIEMNNEIMVNINIENRSIEKDTINNKDKTITNINPRNINTITQRANENLRVSEVENRQRRPNNQLLRDLIRILILNRLLGGGNIPGRPPRPPFPGPGRPPVRPPFPGPIQPIQPRQENYDNYLKF